MIVRPEMERPDQYDVRSEVTPSVDVRRPEPVA
jgi:hypothetical protein